MTTYNDEETSGSESDTGFEEDMETLRRACSITGNADSIVDLHKSSAANGDDVATYESEDEDLELLRRIKQRFSIPTTGIDIEAQPICMKPLNTILPPGLPEDNDDYEDDFETLRVIQRRFSQYNDSMNNSMESSLQRPEQVGATNIELEKETSNFFVKRINNGQGFPDCVDGRATNQNLNFSSNITPEAPYSDINEGRESGGELVPVADCSFPRSAQAFVEAIKKNRACQKFIRSKLIQIEARMEENGKLRERVKIMKDFQMACRKRTGRALSQKKDARIQLISVPKLRANSKLKDKNSHPLYRGPAENPHVATYRDTMSKYPFSLSREPWSKEEKENLVKGIKQQFQEMLMQNIFSAQDADSNYMDSMIAKVRDYEITPEEIRSFLPRVNWEHLSSMYVTGRSGAECQSRWLNWEDPLINRQPWTVNEDKKLLYIGKQQEFRNWIVIAGLLGTNRTPFQCLARYQRSLNANIIKREWTPAEDEDLHNAVAEYGQSNWQLVASALQGRTGTQCSNRWKKSLNPLREKVGKWTPVEDKRLKIAVLLFGAKNWNKIAKFVPGRTQVQCRERWVNCLNPSLNLNEWTEEEDSKLKAAIAEHGYSWSKIAACVPPRTDSQCRRRWKVLFPHEVPLLQAARKMQKAALISNFVDREEERPALGPNDFITTPLIESVTESSTRRRKTKNKKPMSTQEQSGCETPSEAIPKIRSRRARKVTHTEKVSESTNGDDVENNDGHADAAGSGKSKIKSHARKKNNPSTSSGDTGLGLTNGDDVENIGGHADAAGGGRSKNKPRERKKNKPSTSSGDTGLGSTNGDDVENNGGHADAAGSGRSKDKSRARKKNRPNTSSGDTGLCFTNGDDVEKNDGRADATGNELLKNKPRSKKKNKPNNSSGATGLLYLTNGDEVENNGGHGVAAGNGRLETRLRPKNKNNPNTSSEDMGLLDLTNGGDVENNGGHADATGNGRLKRKPRSKKKNKPNTLNEDTGLSDLTNGGDVENNGGHDAAGSGKLETKRRSKNKNKLNTSSGDMDSLDLTNGDDVENNGGHADTTGNERLKNKPCLKKNNKPNTSNEDTGLLNLTNGDNVENNCGHADAAGNGRLENKQRSKKKNKPNTSSEGMGLLESTNGDDVGNNGGHTDATGNVRLKNKPRSKKKKKSNTSYEDTGLLDLTNGGDVENNGGHADAAGNGRLKNKPRLKKKDKQTTSSGDTGLLDLNNGKEVGAFDTDNAAEVKKITTGKRKRKHGKQPEKIDEVFEVDAISRQKTVTPCSRANEGHGSTSIDITESGLQEVPVMSELRDVEASSEDGVVWTKKQSIIDLCSQSSALRGIPSMMEAQEIVVTPIEDDAPMNEPSSFLESVGEHHAKANADDDVEYSGGPLVKKGKRSYERKNDGKPIKHPAKKAKRLE